MLGMVFDMVLVLGFLGRGGPAHRQTQAAGQRCPLLLHGTAPTLELAATPTWMRCPVVSLLSTASAGPSSTACALCATPGTRADVEWRRRNSTCTQRTPHWQRSPPPHPAFSRSGQPLSYTCL